jgi:outer membrane protein OmpA-like peptidoglycan-associated protein
VAEALQRETSIRFVQVEGHASGEGNRRRSLPLSEARAAAAMRFLIEQGVAADRLGSVGNGSEQPEVRGGTAEALTRNRRVELRIVERAP